MGIEGNFKQISAPLLEIAKQDLYVLDLYLHAKEALETAALEYLPSYLKKKGIDCNLDAVIAEEEWRIGRLDIDSDWHAIHYLLTENTSSWEECQIPSIVVRKEENNRLLINAVMGGTSIEGTTGSFKDFGPVKYLVPSETQQISEALLQISEKEFANRYEEACILNPDVYRTLWDKEVDDYWYRFNCILEYYKIAIKETRGMLLYLGCFYGSDFMWEIQE
ncbi:hypothetical protein NSTC745_01343 [Nostoc sp. DSM 114161]|jgi:hypothetical protein|uniref:DUF1877 family protein n=1 Tax=Nostoc sp. DSM 114161 TaxID=3440143 RepID=UPI004045B4BA